MTEVLGADAVEKLERVYVGRFSLEVPLGASRYGVELEVRHLNLEEVALVVPAEKAFEAAWNGKLSSIAQLKARRQRPYYIEGEINAELVLEPDRFAVVLFHRNNAKSAVSYAALRQSGPVGLWLTRPGDLDAKEQILKTIGEVGRAYQAVTDKAPRPTGDVFHLQRGVLVQPFLEQEKARAVFKGGPLGVEIELFTQSTHQPKGGGLLTRFGEAVARAGAAFASGFWPVRNRGRAVAGMNGEEFVMRDSEAKDLYFMWEFKGEAGSGARPRIQLQMTTEEDRLKEKMAYWDALVDSLKPAAAR